MIKKLSIIAVLIAMVAISLSGCFFLADDTKAIVTIQANGVIELVVDERGRVANAVALNYPAEVAMVNMDIIDEPLAVSVRNIVMTLVNLGYINNLNNYVNIDILTNDAEKETAYNRSIFNIVKKINKDIVVQAFDNKIEDRDYRIFVKNTPGYENTRQLEYRLISNIKRYRNDISYLSTVKHSEEDLTKILTTEYSFVREYGTRELASWFRNNIISRRWTIATECVEILGSNAQIYFDCYKNIAMAIDKIIADKESHILTLEQFSDIILSIDKNFTQDIEVMYNKLLQQDKMNYLGVKEYVDEQYANKVFINNAQRDVYENNIHLASGKYVIEKTALSDEHRDMIIQALPPSDYYNYSKQINSVEDAQHISNIIKDKLIEYYTAQLKDSPGEIKEKIEYLQQQLEQIHSDIVAENQQLIDKERQKLLKEHEYRLSIYKR